MQALEVSIPGSYWDSLLYDGQLYLFTRDGEIAVYNWDRLVGSIPWGSDVKPLAVQFLTRGKAWYSPALRHLLTSPSSAEHFALLVERLTSKRYIIPKRLSAESLISQAQSPVYPHTDVETYYNSLYVGGSRGVHEASLQGDDALRFERILDAPALRMSASYGRLALAAGSDGLLEHELVQPRYRGYRGEMGSTEVITDAHCRSCSWARFDIVGSGNHNAGGFLAAFSNPNWTDDDDVRLQRTLVGIVEANRLFETETDGYMFAASDQLGLVRAGGIELETWNPYLRRRGSGVDVGYARKKTTQFADKRLSSTALDASATVFGAIVELDDSLLVLASDGTSRKLREPINWRCFPRSSRYINHLHITYENQVRIFAFVHDYFQSKRKGPSTGRPQVTDEQSMGAL